MFKINVQTKEGSFEYQTALPPIVGDTLSNNGEYYTVVKRIVFSDNPNFVIINVEKA